MREAKNKWMKDTVELVLGRIRPTVYFGENAPALFSETGRDVADFMIDAGKRHGYGVSFYKTSTLKHGIPQQRPRTFYFFWKGGKAPLMRWYDRPLPDVSEYLSRIDGGSGERFTPDLPDEHFYKFARARWGDEWRTCGEGGHPKWRNALVVLEKYQLVREFVESCPDPDKDPFTKDCKRLLGKPPGEGIFTFPPTFAKDGVYPTVMKKSASKMIHPTEDRYLTMREVGWLMGFPEDFDLPPVKTYNLICQNVPTSTARDMTLDPIDFIRGNLQPSEHEVLWFDNLHQTVRVGEDRRSFKSKPAVEDVFET